MQVIYNYVHETIIFWNFVVKYGDDRKKDLIIISDIIVSVAVEV
jgi:hypothetical protein